MSGSLSSLYGGRGLAFTHGIGSRVYGSDGSEYIDFFNGHGSVLFGHANPALVEALERGGKMLWNCGAGFESPVREELAEELGSLVGGGRVFLCNSGTEAIEAALKLAISLRPGRRRILACRRGFHGRTCGALSLTFNPKYRAPFAGFIANVEHYAPEELSGKIDGDTAAVFIEPIQGEGGVHQLAPGIGEAITEACEKNGALLVADEVQSGLGRCGKPLASQIAGLAPDITALAKGLAGGLPIGAVVWKKELGDFPPHSHGSTYGGNEVIAAVATAALRLLKSERLCERAETLGNLFRAELKKIDDSAIVDVRGVGLLNGVEVNIPAIDVVKAMQTNGVLSLAAGPRVVRFLPSFAATEEDMRETARIFKETLEVLQR